MSLATEEFDRSSPDELLMLIRFDPNGKIHGTVKKEPDFTIRSLVVLYFSHLHEAFSFPGGEVVVSLHDAVWYPGERPFPVLAFGRRLNDKGSLLIPDPYFVNEGAYQECFKRYRQAGIRWEDRAPVAYFRGASTGGKLNPNEWKENGRVGLCLLSTASRELLDARLTSLVQLEDPLVGDFIRDAGLMAEWEAFDLFQRYRYLIEIDGNANSWGFFKKLGLGSLVFRVDSKFEQWFYPEIKAWEHYVPVKTDLSDLLEKLEWARNNDEEAKAIAERGVEFVTRWNYQEALIYGGDLCAQLLSLR